MLLRDIVLPKGKGTQVAKCREPFLRGDELAYNASGAQASEREPAKGGVTEYE